MTAAEAWDLSSGPMCPRKARCDAAVCGSNLQAGRKQVDDPWSSVSLAYVWERREGRGRRGEKRAARLSAEVRIETGNEELRSTESLFDKWQIESAAEKPWQGRGVAVISRPVAVRLQTSETGRRHSGWGLNARLTFLPRKGNLKAQGPDLQIQKQEENLWPPECHTL